MFYGGIFCFVLFMSYEVSGSNFYLVLLMHTLDLGRYIIDSQQIDKRTYLPNFQIKFFKFLQYKHVHNSCRQLLYNTYILNVKKNSKVYIIYIKNTGWRYRKLYSYNIQLQKEDAFFYILCSHHAQSSKYNFAIFFLNPKLQQIQVHARYISGSQRFPQIVTHHCP